MNLDKLDVFLKIVNSGNITRAAKELKVPKSKVSRILTSLEKELGHILLHRSTREMKLSDTGRQLYERSKPHMEELHNLWDYIGKKSKIVEGLIRLTASTDLGHSLLPQLLADFQKEYPKVKFDLILSQSLVDLVHESIDIAIRIGPLASSSLKAQKIGMVRLRLFSSPSYLEKVSSPSKLSDLSRLNCLHFGQDRPFWNFTDGKQQEKIRIYPTITTNDPELLMRLTQKGEGISLLPTFLCDNAIKDGSLIPLFRSWHTSPAPVHLVHPYKKDMPERVRKFWDFLARELPKTF